LGMPASVKSGKELGGSAALDTRGRGIKRELVKGKS